MSPPPPKALTKRNASTALMPPPPAPKRIKRPSVVLDEDTYTSAISHIIRRDYFPGLAETDAQRDYLSALDSKDKGWIRESGRKLTEVMTPVPGRRARATRFESRGVDGGQTPSVWSADTPRTQEGEEEKEEEVEGLGKLDNVDLDLGLGAFQAKYTSEDQESFNQILDRANKKRFEKNAWLHDGNKYASKQRLAQQKVLEARNTSTDLIVRPSQDLDIDRPAAPNSHKHTAFNTLMFKPDGIEAWAPTRAQHAEDASLAPPKRVLHHNTRLPPEDTESKRPPSPTMSSIRDAIAGRPRLSASEGGYTGNETPRVNGYAFVDARPPSPDDDDDEAPTDLLERFGTKGSFAAPFTMHESTPREKMHHKMVDRIASSRRPESTAFASAPATSAGGIGQGLGIFKGDVKTPRFVSAPTPAIRAAMTPGGRNTGAFTPAAQRLFDRVGGTPKGGMRGGFEGGGGSGRQWATPTPKVRRRP
jgi:protein DGCR14